MDKSFFTGKVVSIQPHIRLTRSFDESTHSYLGYAIRLNGEVEGQQSVFSVGIGKAAHGKHQLKGNDTITGECLPVTDPEMEPVDYFKVSRLTVLERGGASLLTPPWEDVPPDLDVYRERGCRRLSAKIYEAKCQTCMWGARMPVEIIVDNWNPGAGTRHRMETFCYGPLNCKLYKAGPNRKVEGRHGRVYVEEDWVDEMAVSHRDPEE